MEQPELIIPRAYLNTGLFADYYLAEKIPQEKVWRKALADPKTQELFEQLKELYGSKKVMLEGANEAQTEEEFIRPILTYLGFSFIVQTPTKTMGRSQTPDYALFADDEAKQKGFSEVKQNNYSNALAISDAKYWGRPLDKKMRDTRDTLTNQNPTFQISSYLVSTKVRWAILTNGRYWRLYSRDQSQTMGEYFQVDLLNVIESGDLIDFLYFYSFFRKESFQPDPTESLLDQMISASIEYGAELQENLKKKIFEEIFIYLTKGLAEWRKQNGEYEETTESLKEIFDNTLILLYRLLFVLYAESRDLLPVKEKDKYYTRSLARIKSEIKGDIESSKSMSKVSTEYWDDLINLFHIIDRGDPDLNIPKYNGGLFSKSHNYLEDNKIADFFLVEAIYLLATYLEPAKNAWVFVDYKSLGVQQLGSIYEGLLEFHLSVAEQELAVVIEKSREKYVPVGQIARIQRDTGTRVKPGELYLENTKAERKATGSYYTPDYIVKYIVENTVGPLVQEIESSFSDEVELLRHDPKYKSLNAKQKNDELKGRDPALKILELKVCDPAMGSGHFLVSTVDFISNRIFETLTKHSDHIYFGKEHYESPIYQQIQGIRESIIQEMGNQQVTIDREKLEDDKVIIRRMVMKRCIFGVDLNYLAVELAKLSLWLNSFTIGAPLSFLDHHLKWGDSLSGSSIDEIQQEMDKSIFGSQFTGLLSATDAMIRVGELTDSTFAELQESQEGYKRAIEWLAPYKTALSIWTSQYLGNDGAKDLIDQGKIDPDSLEASIEQLSRDESEIFRRSQKLQEEKNLFHWELEFPEVFYGEVGKRSNAGFDAVIGNPPYVGFHGSFSKEFLKQKYISATARFDLYMPFLELACYLSRIQGFMGFICPTTFVLREHGRNLRNLLTEKSRPIRIHDFGDLPVFEKAQNYTGIFIFRRGLLEGECVISRKYSFEPLQNIQLPMDGSPWQLTMLLGTSSAPTFKLSQLCPQIGEGIVTGFNPAYIVTPEELPQGAFIKRVIEGEDIYRYHVTCSQQIIYPYELRDNKTKVVEEKRLRSEDPEVLKHLSKHKDRLAARSYLGQTSKSWFELWRPRDIKVLGTHKLVTPKLNKLATFSLVGRDIYYLDTVYGITVEGLFPYSEFYLLALLNSKLTTIYLRSVCPPKANGYFSNEREFLKSIPIRAISFTTPDTERVKLASKARKLLEKDISSDEVLEYIDILIRHKHKSDQNLVNSHNSNALYRECQIPKAVNWEQSDVVHDILAYLGEQMLKMNKKKHKEINGFLEYIERITGLNIEELSNKTIVKNYHNYSFEKLLIALERNKNRLKGFNPKSREDQEHLAGEFNGSLTRLNPLKTRIQETDRIINDILYKLYGLTEEDIQNIESILKEEV
jgi:hypothetical protein